MAGNGEIKTLIKNPFFHELFKIFNSKFRIRSHLIQTAKARILVGPNTNIHPKTLIKGFCVIGDNTSLDEKTSLENCVIGGDLTLQGEKIFRTIFL